MTDDPVIPNDDRPGDLDLCGETATEANKMTTEIIIQGDAPAPIKTTRLVLPLPPSVNSYWVNRINKKTKKRGRMRSKRAKKYVAQAGFAIIAQGRPQFGDSPVVVEMYLHHSPYGGDIDNFSKGVLDALTHWAVWRDDDQVIGLHINMCGQVDGGLVVLDIRRATNKEIEASRSVMDEITRKEEYGF